MMTLTGAKRMVNAGEIQSNEYRCPINFSEADGSPLTQVHMNQNTPLKRYITLLIAVFMVLSLTLATMAEAETPADRAARMEWWREARFGMFVHWGLYAIPAGEWQGKEIGWIGEWIMSTADIPVDEYEQLAKQFNPTTYDPRAWVRAAKDAGVKYIVVTSKHHDGFCLFDSDATDWDVVDATPHGKDLLVPLAEACRAEGIKFCVYYSIMDWHHPAQGRGPEHYNPTTIKEGRRDEYVQYMRAQLAELLDTCDPEVLWFDGEWPDWWREQDGKDLYAFLHERKPALIINNRIGKGRDGMRGLNKDDQTYAGDFGTPEQEIPPTGLPGVDWESCMTMNDTWGFKRNDHNWKSSEALIRNLVDIASKGGNYLLNVGPTANGEIPEESLKRLAAIGKWIDVNGESIYDTSASPFAKLPWGRATQRIGDAHDDIYLHVFDWPSDGKLKVPAVKGKLTSVDFLAKGQSPVFKQEADGVTIQLPTEPLDPIDTVIKLRVAH
jgi:alpha-L-fucosidase